MNFLLAFVRKTNNRITIFIKENNILWLMYTVHKYMFSILSLRRKFCETPKLLLDKHNTKPTEEKSVCKDDIYLLYLFLSF